jgi:hypothetical protein
MFIPMNQFPHDDFAKTYLTELLRPMGTTIVNRPLKTETRYADLWFELSENAEDHRTHLGLLGELLTRDALIEVFRNPATDLEIRTSQSKLTTDEIERTNKAKRNKETIIKEKLPWLWLIMPTASSEIRKGFGVRKTKHLGVYSFQRLQRTGLIVVHQLAKTEQTLLLRVLGRAEHQKRAIDELVQIPEPPPLYRTIEETLTAYRAILESRGKITPEDEELLMNLSIVYQNLKEDWREDGKKEGKKEGEDFAMKKVAIGLLQKKSDLELILDVTGLTQQQIQQLSDRLAAGETPESIIQ